MARQFKLEGSRYSTTASTKIDATAVAVKTAMEIGLGGDVPSHLVGLLLDSIVIARQAQYRRAELVPEKDVFDVLPDGKGGYTFQEHLDDAGKAAKLMALAKAMGLTKEQIVAMATAQQ